MKNLTEVVFILDRSGSMGGLEEATIQGFNDLIEKQKKEEGQAFISTVLFDTNFDVIHHRLDCNRVVPLTKKEYFVRGSTALLDAIGRSINKIDSIHRHLKEEDRPDKTLFIIMTDGHENASREFTYPKIANMISRHKEINHWEFLFLGANIDAELEAMKVGIAKENAATFYADEVGTSLNYEVMSDTISSFRKTSQINNSWRSRVNEDVQKRKKR